MPRKASPVALAGKQKHPVKVPVVADIDEKQLKTAAKYGTIEDGKVFVKDGSEQREVGPVEGDEPLMAYARKFFEHEAALERFHGRLETSGLSVRDIESGLKKLEAPLEKPDFVGSIPAYRKRFKAIQKKAIVLRDKLAAERDAARAVAVAEREEIVAKAEALAAKPENSIHWKDDTAALRALLDAWKTAQKDSARVGKEAEKNLWQRFAHARSSFEKVRKHHFAELDKTNSGVASKKEDLVARAEALTGSTDWDKTARAFRDLMGEWKEAGRGRRSTDDALWKRFQTAQDGFFDAKRQVSEAEENALASNVEAKEAAVKAAEALLPIKDVRKAKDTLRSIQDRFEAAGSVPRSESAKLNGRMGAVERAIREMDEAAWTKHSPELEARATGAAAQLIASIADLNQQLEDAEKAGDARAAKDLKDARDARQSWLDQIQVS